jgi:ribose transport system permease protein
MAVENDRVSGRTREKTLPTGARKQQGADVAPAMDTEAAAFGRPVRSGPSSGTRFRPSAYTAVYLGIIFLVVFSILQPRIFLTASNFRVTFSQGIVTVVLGLAFLVPLAAGVYDLSIGAMMELSLSLVMWFSLHTSLPPALTAVLSVLACCFVGLLSGVVTVKFRVNSLIATLGVSQLLSAATLTISNNTTMVGNLSNGFLNLGANNLFGIPYVVCYVAVIAVIIWFVLEHTPAGRSLFAVGGNAEAARLAGVAVDAVVYRSLVASAAIAGLAGVIYAMQVGTYSAGSGTGLLFPALAAVFFGASQFSGRPNVWGTIVAFFALALGVKGLQLQFGPGTFWIDPLFQGVALIIAVSFASRQVMQQRRGRTGLRYRRQPATAAAPVGGTGQPGQSPPLR